MAKKNVEPAIATRIRAAIQSKGDRLAEFARQSGIPYPSLMDYYKGSRKPGFDALATLIEYTGVNADWLLLGKGTMRRSTPPVQEQILGHIMQVLALSKMRQLEGNSSVHEDAEPSLYAIEEAELRSKINQMGELAALAANIYNRVAHMTDETEREAQIQTEARHMLRLQESLTENHLPSPGTSDTSS